MIRSYLNILSLLLLIVLVGCNRKTSIPFPENASEFNVPDTISFEFPEAEAIDWKVVSMDSLPEVTRHPLNLDQLPSKPFIINSFNELSSSCGYSN